jgi:hypothetical protein
LSTRAPSPPCGTSCPRCRTWSRRTHHEACFTPATLRHSFPTPTSNRSTQPTPSMPSNVPPVRPSHVPWPHCSSKGPARARGTQSAPVDREWSLPI